MEKNAIQARKPALRKRVYIIRRLDEVVWFFII